MFRKGFKKLVKIVSKENFNQVADTSSEIAIFVES